MVDRYAGEGVAVFEIWSWYRRQIALRQPAWAEAGQWRYASFSNGVPIRAAARLLYRDVRRRELSFDDPFDAAGPFYALLANAYPALLKPLG